MTNSIAAPNSQPMTFSSSSDLATYRLCLLDEQSKYVRKLEADRDTLLAQMADLIAQTDQVLSFASKSIALRQNHSPEAARQISELRSAIEAWIENDTAE